MNIEIYRIKDTAETVMVPCEVCVARGIVSAECGKCGGKGIHKRTIYPWRVAKKTETVIKIDRDSRTAGLRYWTSSTEYFAEENKIAHFTKEDAEDECARRNKAMGLETILSTLENNKKIEKKEK